MPPRKSVASGNLLARADLELADAESRSLRMARGSLDLVGRSGCRFGSHARLPEEGAPPSAPLGVPAVLVAAYRQAQDPTNGEWYLPAVATRVACSAALSGRNLSAAESTFGITVTSPALVSVVTGCERTKATAWSMLA